jgi:hypothetical protein
MKIGDKLIATDLCIMNGNEDLICPEIQSSSLTIGKVYNVVDKKLIDNAFLDINLNECNVCAPAIAIIDDKNDEHWFTDTPDKSDPDHWSKYFKIGCIDERLS